MKCHASYSLSPLGTTIFFTSPCPRVFPPECRVEFPSNHGRHKCVLPCLLMLLSSPLLTFVPTAESTVFANLSVIRLRRGASRNLFALSQFVLVPAHCTLPFPLCLPTCSLFGYAAEHLGIYLRCLSSCSSPPTVRFHFPREGRGGEEGGVIASCNPFGLGMRRSIRDIGVFCPRDIRGRIQGRILGVSRGTCSCGGLVCQVPVYDLLPCLRSRTQFWVEPRLDSPTRVGE